MASLQELHRFASAALLQLPHLIRRGEKSDGEVPVFGPGKTRIFN
jgi:hypothetical protein